MANELELSCANHPGLYAPREHDGKRLCWGCWKALGISERPRFYAERAYGTGLGPQAHAEAQEAKRYSEDYERMKPLSHKDKRYL